MTADAARVWMALRAAGRSRFSEGGPEDLLRTGGEAIELGLISELPGNEQATALRDIAARVGRILRDREVPDDDRCAFVRAIPRLISGATAREAIDARIEFWPTLLVPLLEAGSSVSGSLRKAISEALASQAASPDEITQFSARHGQQAWDSTLER